MWKNTAKDREAAVYPNGEANMRFSLKTKTVLLVVFIALFLSTVATVISSLAISQLVDSTYRNRADDISHTVDAILDAEQAGKLKNAVLEIYRATEQKVASDAWGTPEFDAYIARFAHLEQTEEFLSLREKLRRIQDINDVDCLYLVIIDIPTEAFIYIVDAAYEDICPPGCIDPIYEENRDLLVDPNIGFPPYITNTEPYGWLVTAGTPVYNAAGELVCYAMVDISMDVVRANQTQFILIYGAALSVLTVLVCIVGIWAVNRFIIRPINLLSGAAAHYSAQMEDNSELDNLPIKSKDEIQSLYSSMLKMTQDIRGYIDSLRATTQELTKTRIEADEMNELAHRDALTGVGSKLAYDQQAQKLTEEMKQGSARYGIVMVDMNDLKKMNDTYGHERGNDAIQKTCSLICDVFAHSPVYRFGGDEFVVVIKGRDYDQIKERVSQFRAAARAAGGQPWEKVNAAIGYALYEGEDTVDDVFRRADHLMYEQKKQMKANGGNA